MFREFAKSGQAIDEAADIEVDQQARPLPGPAFAKKENEPQRTLRTLSKCKCKCMDLLFLSVLSVLCGSFEFFLESHTELRETANSKREFN